MASETYARDEAPAVSRIVEHSLGTAGVTFLNSSGRAGTSSTPKLAFLDGIRGLAAFYVVIHHAVFEFISESRPRWISHLLFPFNFGAAAVGVFIVLSGYCLMLPVARSEDGRLPGGILRYFWRRGRRILPPYYAALGFCLLLIALTSGVPLPPASPWHHALPAFKTDTILSHVFLVHNCRYWWFYAIDPPMWSVAVEWQIYFLLPILLVILYRLGFGAFLAFAMALGFGFRGASYLTGNSALLHACEPLARVEAGVHRSLRDGDDFRPDLPWPGFADANSGKPNSLGWVDALTRGRHGLLRGL